MNVMFIDQARIKQYKCVFEGKEYGPAERMYPSGDSCYHCLCGEGFNNKTSLAENPHCQRVNCNIELNDLADIMNGGVPIYYNTPSCCPIDIKFRTYILRVVQKKNDGFDITFQFLLFHIIFVASKDDVVESGPTSEYANDEKFSCTFGDHKLKYGDRLKTTDKCLKCECTTPPYLTCVKVKNC